MSGVPTTEPGFSFVSSLNVAGTWHGYYTPDVLAWRAWWRAVYHEDEAYRAACMAHEDARSDVDLNEMKSSEDPRLDRALETENAWRKERDRVRASCPVRFPRRLSEIK